MNDTASASPSPVAGLGTERLLLRAWTVAEARAVAAGARRGDWAADFPAEGDTVVAPMIAADPDWLGPFGHRLVVERSTGLVVGSLGLLWPPAEGTVELGYGIAPSRRGRGYAPEAVRALVAHAYTAPQVRGVYATVATGNPASVRVLAKAGFAYIGDGEEPGTACYGAPRPRPEHDGGPAGAPDA